MTMLRTAGFTLAFLFASTSARADEISDEEDVCRKADKGAACTVRGVVGKCEDTKCSRIDYSGDKPKAVERDCRTCVVATGAVTAVAPTKAEVPARADPPPTAEVPAKAEPQIDADVPAKAEVPAKADAPVKADAPAKSTPAKSEPAAAKSEPAAAKSGCAVEPGPLSLGTIPLGIVLVAIARRRRR